MAKKKGEPVPEFAAAVREARAKLNLSQGDVATLAGCGNSAVADIERGDRSPSLSLASRIAAVLKIRTRLAEYATPKLRDKIPNSVDNDPA